MNKFLIALGSLTFLGLVIVYGEVEAVKIGYDIRQLNILKLELRTNLKEKQLQIASLKAPENLERLMSDFKVELTNPQVFRLAKARNAEVESYSTNRGFFSKMFETTAQADSAR